MQKRLWGVFIAALVLNLIWEFLHSALYVHYQGGEITNFILFRAAVVDALIIAAILFITRKHKLLFFILALLTAIGIEVWALSSGRWAYGVAMPIIPLLGTGLTPTIQLAITGFLAQKIVGFVGH